jgi:hypothetical protein
MDMLGQLDHDIEELKKTYEAYFQGTNRIPPEREFARVQKTIRQFKEEKLVVNTAIKFRLATLVSKFQAYSRYWARVMNEIAEGRYFRDKFKADLRVGKITPAGEEEAAVQKPAAESINPDEQKLLSLHKEYMMARLECNQDVKGLTKEQLKHSIAKSLPALQKQYPGKKIEFKVVIEGGKAKLKAVPK